ncbi:uncharacterized protein MELLADRAFT_110929 [Melampsora larici-populina 98AG31]|uniref:SigF-like NTF2-like domain-containing protein n=1 Tax=Melampsora larici-populina (strain 98AG31 / pathotype 3-4-7) TaxID=747676 RepID=F4S1G7_MELLP|nr:uncharacterized protein MELLADRAFT_110929 [Melampsora larici-populina 98AG31]EGG01560.1 hypothetical protein MELLADRAFT_110929 [Melampsora larici-populina 98AG31]
MQVIRVAINLASFPGSRNKSYPVIPQEQDVLVKWIMPIRHFPLIAGGIGCIHWLRGLLRTFFGCLHLPVQLLSLPRRIISAAVSMDNPIAEIKDVVRSITEPYEATTLAKNVEKYFTADAYILHPAFNQPHTVNGRDDLVGIYKMLCAYLRKCSDGKYRIWRQHDNLATDLAMSGVSDDIPGLSFVSNVIKSTLGVITGKLGRFLLSRGWLGP